MTKEAIAAGKAAALYVSGQAESTSSDAVSNPKVFPGKVVKPVSEQAEERDVNAEKGVRRMTCIICPRGCQLTVTLEDEPKVSGNSCPRGEEYAIAEITHPMRTLTTTIRVRLENGSIGRVSVKSKGEIPKEEIFKLAEKIHHTIINGPVQVGDEVLPGVLATSGS